MMKMLFSGDIKKSETKSINGKTMIELSVCKKNKTKEGEEASFTWLRCQCWDCPEWLAPRLIKGVFVSGCGDFTLRSYVGKDGQKAISADVRCGGFDISVADDRAKQPDAKPYEPTKRSPPVVHDHMSKSTIAKLMPVDDSESAVPF